MSTGEKPKSGCAPNELLLNVLREKLELTGTKYACGIGECSACTIQMDGKAYAFLPDAGRFRGG